MGERCNSKLGREIAYGDCLVIDGQNRVRVHGFIYDKYDAATGEGKRVASVTYNNDTILKDYTILPGEWYQLC